MSFGSPASDYVQNNLDLNQFLVPHKASTYFLKVSGDAMTNAGIIDGDFLVVDRAREVSHNQIIVVEENGELVVRRFKQQNDQICLMPENEKYAPHFLKSSEELVIWGCVSAVFRKL